MYIRGNKLDGCNSQWNTLGAVLRVCYCFKSGSLIAMLFSSEQGLSQIFHSDVSFKWFMFKFYNLSIQFFYFRNYHWASRSVKTICDACFLVKGMFFNSFLIIVFKTWTMNILVQINFYQWRYILPFNVHIHAVMLDDFRIFINSQVKMFFLNQFTQ